MKLIYVGNKLTKYGATPTTIDTLSILFQDMNWDVVVASDKKNQFFRFLDMLWTVFKNRNADFVLIDTYSTKAFWFGFVISQFCRLLQIKYVPFLHGGALPQRLKSHPKCCALFFNNAYKSVAPSPYLKHEFEKFGYTELVYIPNVLEMDLYPKFDKSFDSPQILWVRAFASLYKPEIAVEVLSALKAHYPDATLCMVGPDKDGSMAQTKAKATQLGVEVDFTGKLSKQDWILKSKSFNVFLNTTSIDNTPVSVMEALALGIPVVSTNVGGLPFLITDQKDGLLVDANDVSAMVSSIDKLMRDCEFANQLRVNGFVKSAAWDWNQVKNEWILLFSQNNLT